MKIAVSSEGNEMESKVDQVFGRCSYFIIVDTETGAFEAKENPFKGEPRASGSKCAEMLSETGVDAAIARTFGPRALESLSEKGIDAYISDKTVKQAIDEIREGKLKKEILERKQI